MLPLEISADGYRLFGESVDDLSEVFSQARALEKERHEISDVPLIFDFQRIRYGTFTVYDSEREFIDLATSELEHRQSGEEGHMNLLSALGVRPLSLVGTLLTYEKTWACACAGGPPTSDVSWTSVDLATRKAPVLVDFLEQESLVEALRSDRCVAPLLAAPGPSPTSVEEVAALLKKEVPASADCSGASEAFSDFAFAGYDTERDLASVRLGFRHEISPGHIKTSYLGLLVHPRAEFRTALAEASAGRGFFMTEER